MAMPNIKDLLNPAKKEERIISTSGELLNEAYTEEALLKIWQDFAEQLRAEGKQSEFLVLNRSWQRNEHIIHLVLDNHLQEDMLNIMKPDLLEHLRRILRNQHIHISATVQESDTTRKIYTTQDKLAHLSEKHPVIHDLRKRFGLDTDS